MTFTDIAAYPESKVQYFVRKILNDPRFQGLLEKFHDLPQLFKFPNLQAMLDNLKHIDTVKMFQELMNHLLKQNIASTTKGVTYSGLEDLDKDKGYVLLSNHRSTSLDPSYTNYILMNAGRNTLHTGCGDNIFKTSWLEHIIRLNKGFVVKRNVEDIDDKLFEADRLSAYINSLVQQKEGVWIAHRNGRSKDGTDKTDSVLVSMLYRGTDYADYSSWLSEVPVHPLCISWESIPCDLSMAREIAGEPADVEGNRDLFNIMSELGGFKGGVHYHFAERVIGVKRKEIVRKVDEAIHSNYRLWDSNWLAYTMVEDISKEDRIAILDQTDKRRGLKILNRRSELPSASRKAFLEMYANPVRSALAQAGGVKELIAIQNERKKERIKIK